MNMARDIRWYHFQCLCLCMRFVYCQRFIPLTNSRNTFTLTFTENVTHTMITHWNVANSRNSGRTAHFAKHKCTQTHRHDWNTRTLLQLFLLFHRFFFIISLYCVSLILVLSVLLSSLRSSSSMATTSLNDTYVYILYMPVFWTLRRDLFAI